MPQSIFVPSLPWFSTHVSGTYPVSLKRLGLRRGVGKFCPSTVLGTPTRTQLQLGTVGNLQCGTVYCTERSEQRRQ